MELAFVVLCIGVLAYVVGTSDRLARGRQLHAMQADWQAEIETYLASDPCDPDRANPWLITLRSPALHRQRAVFLARYQPQHDAWHRRRRMCP